MEQGEFLQALKALHFVDRHDIEAELHHAMSGEDWQAFRSNPSRYLMRAEPFMARAIWSVVARALIPARGVL